MSNNVFKELSDAMADAVEKAGGSAVMVDARRKFPASGILLAADKVLTADHVIEREEDIKVVLGDGTESRARLAGRDPGSDLALLNMDNVSTAPGEISKVSARVGQLVMAIARPSRGGIESSLGAISAIGGPVRTGRGGMLDRYYKTDLASFPGFSGGALIGTDGMILGINTSGFSSGSAITIPADIAWKIAETLEKHGRIKRGFLGIRSQTVNIPSEARRTIKSRQETGLLIVGIEEQSPATKAGIMVGDILLGIGGEAIEHHEELFTRLSSDLIGKSTPIDVLRGGIQQTLNVVIGER